MSNEPEPSDVVMPPEQPALPRYESDADDRREAEVRAMRLERLAELNAAKATATPAERRRRWPSQSLTARQRAFLKLLADGRDFGEAQRQLRIADATMQQWLAWGYFRKRAGAGDLGGHDGRRDAALDRAAADAAETLAAAVRGEVKLDANRQRACVEVLKLARVQPAAAKAAPDDEDEASHDPHAPDLDAAERRKLLATLQGRTSA